MTISLKHYSPPDLTSTRTYERYPVTYDLVIKNGTVIDPSQKTCEKKDIAVAGGKIAAVENYISDGNSHDVIEAEGLLVTPGLVDLHVHVWWGVAHLAIEADPACVYRGVTTAIDAGSSGSNTIAGFHRYVIDQAHTRVLAFLHISGMGQLDNNIGELEDIRWARVEQAIEAAELHSDVIVGIKVRLTENIVGSNDLIALKRALEAGQELNKPVMIHIGGSVNQVEEFLEQLRPGDIVTHSFTGRPHGILDNNNKVIDAAWDAMNRGVIFDVGHGAGSFSFPVAEACLEQGLGPGTVSSDVHRYNIRGPVFDLMTTLSKYIHLGYSIGDAIALGSSIPSAAVGLPDNIGTLKIGADADIAIIEHRKGPITFSDADGNERNGNQLLLPVETLRKGKRFNPQHSAHPNLLGHPHRH
ncbi:MAG: amidohydrolase/deacetylase family metallohydrolase [SAR202 cluster bacterium]|nr:MAG: amidohydrolase/deacetylase family metallohydrolase [SAR202 cluster bacterium]MQG90252.1 amidohydrolase/deacetylase family metallohydrolase [SAR202 cluster bacterium]